jgi:hypothetical protein
MRPRLCDRSGGDARYSAHEDRGERLSRDGLAVGRVRPGRASLGLPSVRPGCAPGGTQDLPALSGGQTVGKSGRRSPGSERAEGRQAAYSAGSPG